MTDLTGLGMAFGTADDGIRWVGRRGRRQAEVPVNDAMIRAYCALVEDANPDYWDRRLAPPGMLMAWLMPLPWRPGNAHRRTGLFALEVPLPDHHIINVSTDTELSAPLRVGDHVEATEEIVEISPPKRTRLGEGHFITTVTDSGPGIDRWPATPTCCTATAPTTRCGQLRPTPISMPASRNPPAR